jgi:hypothetical protein
MDDVRTRIEEEATEMERRWARSSERRTGYGRRLSSTAGRGGRSMETAVDVAVIAGGWDSYMDGAIETGLRGGREIEAILS